MIRVSLLSLSLLLATSCDSGGENQRAETTKAPVGQADADTGNNPFAGAENGAPGGGGGGGGDAGLKALQDAVDEYTAVTYTGDIKPLVDKYCVSCHAGATPQGGLSLENFENVKTAVKKMETRVRNGTMPPKASELSDEAKVRLDDLETLLGLWQDKPSALAESPKDVDLKTTYSLLVGPLTTKVCAKCHTGATPPGNILLDTQARLEENLDAGINAVSEGRMPPSLDSARRSRILNILETWKADGTP